MSLPNSAEVLIVGAGPTGLTLALALQKHSCPDVVIVDAQQQNEHTSRALAIHAATVEVLGTLGVSDRIVDQGLKLNKSSIWAKGHGEIALAYFPSLSKYTKYPFITSIPQHVTESILGDAAKERGIVVHRPLKVVDVKPNTQDAYFTDVTFEDGQVIRARCVVGADGTRSTIRKALDISYADPAGEPSTPGKETLNMIVADVTLAGPPPVASDAINLILGPDNTLNLTFFKGNPYPSANPAGAPVYRITTGIPPSLGAPPSIPDTAYLQRLLDAWGPNVVFPHAPKVTITGTLWSSRFRTYSAVAGQYVARLPDGAGPLCLLGDAAHIHPPMGGQGLNLGIRDAAKLAPVLAAYVASARASTGTAAPSQEGLERWGVQRRQRAVEVIALVKSLQGRLWLSAEKRYFLGVIPYDPLWFQLTVMKFLASFGWFGARNAWQVSGLADP